MLQLASYDERSRESLGLECLLNDQKADESSLFVRCRWRRLHANNDEKHTCL